jgi:uncharacterized protein (DUF433 family)
VASDGAPFDGTEEVPRYSIPEAAQYVKMPRSTLSTWVRGRSYPVAKGDQWWENLIIRPDPQDPRLSFSNLIEAYVLNALRKEYLVRMKEVRTALLYAADKWGVTRVLLSEELRVMQGSVFLDRLGSLINLGKPGQQALPHILDSFLKRIEWNKAGLPARLSPVTQVDPAKSPTLIRIDPNIAVGRPVIWSRAIKTSTINNRFLLGESLLVIAQDYDLGQLDVEEAIRYEQPYERPSAAAA